MLPVVTDIKSAATVSFMMKMYVAKIYHTHLTLNCLPFCFNTTISLLNNAHCYFTQMASQTVKIMLTSTPARRANREILHSSAITEAMTVLDLRGPVKDMQQLEVSRFYKLAGVTFNKYPNPTLSITPNTKVLYHL